MSLKIGKNNTIKLTRGDTAYIDVSDFKYDGGGDERQLEPGDRIIFRLKGSYQYLEKDLVIDTEKNIATLILNPEDTKPLDFETYKYELELVTLSDEHLTFVENSDFVVGVEQED